ncbi:MAG TPA: UDP-2,3-diacylglucosamine diphosphatase LpxI [Vicinamibacterales bacterium]|nr:UDP-2,3-diacylglucosamine diphosphatase LpxI [Vicinamibacterales bacterium]
MPIGLIAGNGSFPFLVLRAARQLGHDVAVVAITGETFPELETLARQVGNTTFVWVDLGALGQCIATLKSAGVSRAVMAGQVRHVKLFGGVAPDATLLTAMRRLPASNTDALIAAVATVLEQHGITLMDSTSLLSDLMARPGIMTARAPDEEMLADFEFGYRVADTVAGIDVGQTIVVKTRAVVAVEAMEGTDAVIARAGQLAGAGTRVVKVAKPAQDMRFDVPVVGRATIEAMRAAGADGLSIDAGKTLMLDGDGVIRAADEAGIVVVGRPR